MPGGMLSLSASSTTANSAFIWASLPTESLDAGKRVLRGVLRAFDATTLQELWNSNQRIGDNVGNFAKFVPPTVANGLVFLPTFQNPTSPPQDSQQNDPVGLNQLLVYSLMVAKPMDGALLTGGGTDIGIGPTKERDTWTIGNESGNDHSIWHWNLNGRSFEHPPSGGLGTAIDVDP